jgi:hypothetical protein
MMPGIEAPLVNPNFTLNKKIVRALYLGDLVKSYLMIVDFVKKSHNRTRQKNDELFIMFAYLG